MTQLIEVAALLASNPQIAGTVATLLEDLLGEPFKVAGNLMADQIYFWQCKNRFRIAEKTNQILEEKDVAAKVLPAGFLVPLLDAAGNVEDDTLQEMWARLLASSVEDERHQHPAFIQILASLTADEARIVEEVYTNMLTQGGVVLPMLDLSKRLNLNDRPIGPLIAWQSVIENMEHFQNLSLPNRLPTYFCNLERLSLLAGAQNERVLLSQWGTEFATACTQAPPT